MTIIVRSPSETVELFHVPDDFQEFEDETGARIAEGFWWWRVLQDGTPDSYPTGPHDSLVDAFADWQLQMAWEPWEEV